MNWIVEKARKAFAMIGVVIFAMSAPSQSAGSNTWYRNDELRIAFAYGSNWQPGQAAESATLHVVDWLGQGGGLIATCYIQVYGTGGLSQLPVERLHEHKDDITASIMRNMRKRFPDSKLISSEALFVDGLPVIMLVREAHGANLGKAIDLKNWTVVTVWREREINFECGSSVPFQFPGNPVINKVESEIMKVLGSLHFER